MDVATLSDRELSELPVDSVDTLIERLPKYFTMCLASKRNSGKTYLMSEIIKKLIKAKKVDMVLVMSNSAGLNKDYQSILPPGLVMKFNEKVLEQLWARQQKTDMAKREHIFIVLDDVLSDPRALRSELVSRIYSLGRHNMLSCAVCSQVANHVLTPVMKQNSDMLLWSKLNRNQLAIIWESLNGVSKKGFIRWAEVFGGVHYNFCVFDNITDKNAPEDFLFVVRAEAK
jgi:hypothetical protein